MDSRIDSHRLRYLFEAVHFGSVRGAAEALGVNPSVVSRQIAQLETDIGIVLIERHSRGIRPTESGSLLIEYFRRQTADHADTLAKLREIQGLQRGHIDVILGEGFVSDLMLGPLRTFWELYPRLTMTFELAGTSEVARQIADDRAHLGLVYNAPSDPRIRVVAESRRPLCLVCRSDHLLAQFSRPVTLREIAAFPLGLMQPSYGTRHLIAMAEASEKLVLSPKLTTSSINVLRHFVMAGLGVTLLPSFSVARDIADGALVAIDIDNPLLCAAEAQIIVRVGRQLPDAVIRLLRFLSSKMLAFQKP